MKTSHQPFNITSSFRPLAGKAIAAAMLFSVALVQAQSADKAAQPSVPDSWGSGPDLPTAAVRAVGIFFPANGRFYVMGGRSADTAGSDLTHPYEFNPSTNTWTTKVGTYPDNQVNNMACGLVNVGSSPRIFCVGGSAAGQTTAAARVFSYDPVADTVTPLTAADDWPGNTAGTILPGGFSVLSNKLYILGGFNINTASTNQIWQFDPNAAVGAKWTQMVNTPVGIMYAPTATIGNIIYVGGASDYVGGTVVDTATSFSFNPTTNTIGAIAAIPRACGETRAIALAGKMWVMGGGRVAPNPGTQIDVYNPASNTWSTAAPFVTPRRNFPVDTDGNRVWLAGGYTTDGLTPQMTTEIFLVPQATSVVSRKIHGASGTFDIPLPLTGTVGVECRSTGGNHTIVATFANTVTLSGASVSSGTGNVGSFNATANQITVNLTGVANAQRLVVTLSNVNDGTTTGDVNIPMGVLAGDSNGNGSVTASDVAQTKAETSNPFGASNFRTDINANGSINATDIGLVKSFAGTQLPPP
jgi:hypothetical protein